MKPSARLRLDRRRCFMMMMWLSAAGGSCEGEEMGQTFRIETTVQSDGTLILNNLPVKQGAEIEVTIRIYKSSSEGLPPYGLAAGEFVVPDDFDDLLPEEIIRGFEGR